jgi:RNA ligase
MAFMAWTEIESFHNVRKFVRVDPGEWWRAKEQLGGTSVVSYKAKVKLHGTNAAIQVHADGRVIAQSRTSELAIGSDNAGFAAWVKANEDAWRVSDKPTGQQRKDMVIFGEWVGPGIQKGVAASTLPKKVFAVFAARPMGEPNPKAIVGATHTVDGKIVEVEDWAYAPDLVVEPDALQAMVHDIPDTYVLPWYKKINIDWRRSDEDLSKDTAVINDWVAAVEENDPWVERTFGIKGTGEGLVFYPVSKAHLGYESFTYLVFKAKGEKHKNIKTGTAAQVNPEVAASVDAFVEMVLTPARLEQGATAVQSDPVVAMLTFDMKLTGKFVSWCLADVLKETTDELEASGLEWKQVEKPLTNKARSWYLERAKAQ